MNNVSENKIQAEKAQYEDYAFGFLEKNECIISSGTWFLWAGTHWERMPNPENAIRKWFLKQGIPQTNGKIDNVYGIINSIASIEKPLPCWNDGRKEKILPFRNGLLNLNNDEFLPPNRNYLVTWCLPCNWDSAAPCPVWEKFVHECLNDDDEQVKLLQEWFGYALSGDTSQQKYMCHVGAAGSGKSTIATVLQNLLAGGAVAFNLRSLASRFGIGSLVGRPLAVVGEVELQGCKDRSTIMEKLKSITGNDSVDVERKNDPVFYSVVLPTRFHIVANTMPSLRDPSLALHRRLMLLWSDRQAQKTDTALGEKLQQEQVGIVRWAVEGYRRLRTQGGFTVPARTKAEMNHVRRDASAPLAFLEDCCEVSAQLAAGANLPNVKLYHGEPGSTTKEELWKGACDWADEMQLDIDPVWFWRDLRAALPQLPPRVQRNVGGRLVDVILGVKFKTLV